MAFDTLIKFFTYPTPMWFAYISNRLNLKRLLYKSEKIPFNLSVISMDPRWKHPFPALVAGPTCCGKSQFVRRLLESGENMIEGAPENIIGVMVFTSPLTMRC